MRDCSKAVAETFASSRISVFVAPASIAGGVETVRSIFESHTGVEPSLVYSGDAYHAACKWTGCRAFRSRSGVPTQLILQGEIYGEAGPASDEAFERLADQFFRGNRNGVAHGLRGSFVLAVLTPGNLNLITDRVASRKVFRWDTPEGTWLDTDLSAFRDRPADPAGVASLIINRFTYADRTILSAVVSLPRARVHSYDGTRWISEEYWRYDFSHSTLGDFGHDLASKRAQLWELILHAINRRTPDRGSLLLLLSGGVDSRAILAGLQANGFPTARLKTASYGSADDDDAAVASELAAFLGLPWTLVPGSQNLPRLVRLNGEHGSGQVFFYPRGLDGFRELVASIEPPVTVFVGDECYGWHDMPLSSPDDVLCKGVGIRSPASVPSYYSYGAQSHESISRTLQADCDELKRRYEYITSLQDLKDVLYLDQRLSNMLLPWRERHIGHFARIVNPHIDEDILEFMKQVPTKFRLNKRLFRETVFGNLGRLGTIRFARAGGCSNDFLDDLFLRHYSEIDELLGGSTSTLDEVLPAELIRVGLAEMCADIQLRHSGAPAPLAALARKIRGITARHRFARERRSQTTAERCSHGFMSLAPIQMATVLQLRWFLSTDRRDPRPSFPDARQVSSAGAET